MQYLFILGNATELAQQESTSVLHRHKISFKQVTIAGRYLLLEADQISLAILQELGGTVKVARVFSDTIVAELTRDRAPGERVVFGLSGQFNPTENRKIKSDIEVLGYKARFIQPGRGDVELSSVVVSKQKAAEIYSVFISGKKVQAKVIWVQDFEDWGKRDYGRPKSSAHIGMLPPKVARMMLNLALETTNFDHRKPTILDPFCGVGTILAEALMLNLRAVGSDNNSSQVAKAKDNLSWLVNSYGFSEKDFLVETANANRVSNRFKPDPVDVIVTEPDLGPNDNKGSGNDKATNDNLLHLYLDCLVDWRKVLTPGGKVVIALPFILDKEKLMGYSFQAGPFLYHRPQALVKRHVYIFKVIK